MGVHKSKYTGAEIDYLLGIMPEKVREVDDKLASYEAGNNDRLQAETAREEAEQARIEAEQARVEAEKAREQAARQSEEQRQSAFEQNEAERAAAAEASETARADAYLEGEAARQRTFDSREAQRQTAYQSAEYGRLEAEEARQAAEAKRQEAEALRDNLDRTRGRNEAVRESNEAERRRAENDRQTSIASMRADITKLIQDAKNAIDMLGSQNDTTATIDTMKEIVAFLEQYQNTDSLASVLSTLRSDIVLWVESQGYLTTHQSLAGLQTVIADLEIIRHGASLGETSVQPEEIADMETKTHASQTFQPKGKYLTSHQDISGKQDVIADLENIRSGAGKGATSVQPAAIADMETKTHASDTYQPKGNYLTQHQSLANYYTKTEIDSMIISTINADY